MTDEPSNPGSVEMSRAVSEGASGDGSGPDPVSNPARRRFLGSVAATAGCAAAGAPAAAAPAGAAAASPGPAWGGSSLRDAFGSLFQDHYQRMSKDEIDAALARIERNAKRTYGVDIHCEDTKPIPGVLFGYALNISKCQGYRDCVAACVRENNQGRDSQVQYIRVLEMDSSTRNLEESEHYYNPATVPVQGKYFMPVQCMQCENPPCVPVCPVAATSTRPDGVVAIDYDRCIGCRYCVAACPYGARTCDFGESYADGPAAGAAPMMGLPVAWESRPSREYAKRWDRSHGGSPVGNARKCHFCLHRLERGRLPACVSGCIGRATYFGDASDPSSLVVEQCREHQVQSLLAHMGTRPRVLYVV